MDQENPGELFEVLREKGCPGRGITIPQEDDGKVGLFQAIAVHLVVLANGWIVAGQPQIDDHAGFAQVMQFGEQIGRQALTGGHHRPDSRIMGGVGDGEDEKVVPDAVDQ